MTTEKQVARVWGLVETYRETAYTEGLAGRVGDEARRNFDRLRAETHAAIRELVEAATKGQP